MLKSEFGRKLSGSLQIPYSFMVSIQASPFARTTEWGEIGKGACEKRKERDNKVDWCNPLCPGTKGSNSNENMPT